MTKTSEGPHVGYEKRRLTYIYGDCRTRYQASRLKGGRVVTWSPEYTTEAEADEWIERQREFDNDDRQRARTK